MTRVPAKKQQDAHGKGEAGGKGGSGGGQDRPPMESQKKKHAKKTSRGK